MNWAKKQSGSAASISCDNYLCHRSIKTPDDIFVTVTRRKPFKDLGTATGFKDAIALCEADAKKCRRLTGGEFNESQGNQPSQ